MQDYAEGRCGRAVWQRCNSLLHSRCFVEGPTAVHQIAPGIDMANHSFTPNATVRCATTLRAPYQARVDGAGAGSVRCRNALLTSAWHWSQAFCI